MGQTPIGNTMPYQRDDAGRVIESYPPEAVFEALREIGPAGTRDVSEKLGCSYETAYQKLRRLEDDGKVTSRRIANARLWEVSE